MKILILDDNHTRHELFKANFKDFNLYGAYNVTRAIQLLQKYEYDALFLDYNLYRANNKKVNGKYLTGYDVALWLSNNLNRCPHLVYIHSSDPEGVQKMHKLLPFAKLKPNLWTLGPQYMFNNLNYYTNNYNDIVDF